MKNGTLTAAGSPHLLKQGAQIAGGETLTVEPCAVVLVAGLGITVGDTAAAPATSGDLVAVGDATHPIVFSSPEAKPDAWSGIGFDKTGAASKLAHVTIERAHEASTPDVQAAVNLSGGSSVVFDHVTVREGKGCGIALDHTASFGPGSGDLTITAMGQHPISMYVSTLASVPDGSFSKNGDDRIEVRHAGGLVAGDVTWPKRSVDYVLRNRAGYSGKVTIEPGVHIFVDETTGWTYEANFDFSAGGSLVADGKAESTRIVIEGDKGKRWHGFAFRAGDNPSGPGLFNFVTIKNAADMPAHDGEPTCADNTESPSATAVMVEHDVLTMSNTEFFDVGQNNYAIRRAFCGPGGDYMTEASKNNVFHGPMHCPVTDQLDCGTEACDPKIPQPSCCHHAYACHGTVEP